MRVPIRHKDALKRFGDLLRDGEKPWEVFEGASLKDYAALLGTVRNSVCVRSVERHGQAMARVKRWPKSTANWALAMAHSRGGILHSRSVLFKTR